MLEGSIQRQGDRVRVTAQLIDARTGAHVWSERWDRPAADVFAVQTELAERVASTLGGYGLLLSESRAAAKRKRPADLEAYDLWALAYEAFMRGKEADLEQALAYADAAIAKDPGLVRAYTKKAWILIDLAKYRNNWNEAFAEMERLARQRARHRSLRRRGSRGPCLREHASLGADGGGDGGHRAGAGAQPELGRHPQPGRDQHVLPRRAGARAPSCATARSG